jgi:integrase
MTALGDDHHLWITPGGMIFFKLGIPKHLRHHFRTENGKPKDRIVESSGTDSRTEARKFRDKRLGYWRAKFDHLEKGGRLDDILPSEVAERTRSVYDSIRAKVEAAAAQKDFEEFTDAVVAKAIAMYTADHPDVVIPSGLDAYLRALFLAANAADQGLPPPQIPGASSALYAPASPQTTRATSGGETFSEALAAYLSWLENEQQARMATVADFRSRGQKFVDHAGDLPLSAITYDVAKGFEEHVAKSAGNGHAANKARSLCYTVFEHARERRKFDGKNPFEFRGRKHTVRSHDKFTADDLHKLFSSPTFTGREIKPKRYGVRSALPWVAAIGLFTGMRGEEIVQLRRGDLRQEKGVWLLDITPAANAAGKLKTVSSKRMVPVHSALIELGLLDYHKALPKTAERLFPNLPADKKDGKFWPTVSKAFVRWRKSKAVGVHRPPEKLTFHSFRHTFTKTLEDIGVSKNDADRLTGHEVEGITFGLYSGPELKRLAKVIEEVQFDLSRTD